jgi:NitT/TauT family transport system permease protein
MMSDINSNEAKKKRKPRFENLNNGVMLFISLGFAVLVWTVISSIPEIGSIIISPLKFLETFFKELTAGSLLINIWVSLVRIFFGFFLGLLTAIPVAFLLGWYKIFRSIVEPWIQFLRTIPPIALIPLVIVMFGVGTMAKVIIIFFAVFLVMVISIYQGVKNVDLTLIKAATVLGANDKDIFFDVVIPASFPYILVGVRLGLASALTTLVAAELTGASKGLGNMIQEAALYFDMGVVILGIVTIGVIGFIFDKLVLFLEQKLTGWQEVRKN